MTPADALVRLQAAARRVGWEVARAHAARVRVLAEDGRLLLDVVVPFDVVQAEPVPGAGWAVTDHGASFDGKPVTVAPSRLRLLKALVEAEGPLSAKELVRVAFDGHTEDTNVRYHIRELRKELKAAFALDEEIVTGDGEGYRLVLR